MFDFPGGYFDWNGLSIMGSGANNRDVLAHDRNGFWRNIVDNHHFHKESRSVGDWMLTQSKPLHGLQVKSLSFCVLRACRLSLHAQRKRLLLLACVFNMLASA